MSPPIRPRVLVIALVALALVYGAAAMYYRLPLSQGFRNAFAAANVWYGEWYIRSHILPGVKRTDTKRNPRDISRIIMHPRTTWDKNLAYPGYTLITTGFSGHPFLVDMEGKPVYYWKVPYHQIWDRSVCIHPLHKSNVFADGARVFPNGDALVNYGAAINAAPYGCGIVKVDKDSKILWEYKAATHHDFTLDEHGNIYLLVNKTVTEPPAGFEGLVYPMSADNIVKLSPDGKELASISLLDAFHGTPFELMMFHGTQGGDRPDDFFHTNSVDVLSAEIAAKFPMFKAGQILVSMRSIHALAVIDPDTRKVVWAYRGFWRHQHEASFQPNGHIMVFDNRGYMEKKTIYSRILEFDPATFHVTWYFAGSRKKPFYAEQAGRVQRLPNGNTLIAESFRSRIFEVTKDGDIVWSYAQQQDIRNEFENSIFTSTRYSKEQLPFLQD